MNKSELLALRKAVSSEEERRSRINDLLKDPNVRKLLELKDLDVTFEQTDKESVIESVLSHFSIEDANNIYVVIGAYRFTRLSFNELEFPENKVKSRRYSNLFLKFLKNLLDKNIKNRISVFDALDDPWIKGAQLILKKKKK